jgi:hypothetical protein
VTQTVQVVEIDCHDHAYHVEDEDYPECGPDNLVRIAETYGILITFLPDHPLASWAIWYRLEGPRANLVRFMADEYCGTAEEAEEYLA